MTQGVQAGRNEALKGILGKTVDNASSALTSFAVRFTDGSGIIFDAVSAPGPMVAARIVRAEELPNLEEAVCSVDWGWICGSSVSEAQDAGLAVRLQLSQAGPLTIGSALWEGKPFLSFQPFRPAKK